jgi:phenylacetate-CoA ligase
VTDFFLLAFPLINYDIGDEIEFEDDGYQCPCGLEHPVIRRVIGRSGEPISLPNGRTVNANLPSYIFKSTAGARAVRRFRFVERKDGRLELLLVVTERFDDAVKAKIQSETRQAFGPDCEFELKLVDSIPFLPNAKHRCYLKEH